MAKMEVEVLCEDCMEYCNRFDINNNDIVKKCVHLEHCQQVRTVVIQRIYEIYEDRASIAYGKGSGLKEPAVWKEAIEILEDLLDE